MGNITFSGLSSGIDSAAIIQQLVYAEQAPIRQYEQKRSDYQSQLSIIQSLNSKLQSLQTKAQDLDTIAEFLSYSASSEDDDIVTATASGTATSGTYSITSVTQMAQAQRNYSDGFSSKEEAGVVGSGTLSFRVGSEDWVDIDITAEQSLEEVVAAINSSEAAVDAGLLFDGTNHYIQITGTETGEDNLIQFQESGVSLNFDSHLYHSAQDAIFVMDGFTIQSATNEVEDAIPGTTLNLHDVPTDTVDVTVQPNTAGIKSKIEAFVTAYNLVASALRSEFAFSGDAKGGNRLAGDATLRGIQTQLSTSISGAIENLGGSFEALSQIGISTTSTGTLKIDSDDLESAISSDTSGVAQLFAGTPDHSVEGIGDVIDDLVESFVDFTDGTLQAKINGINSSITSIGDNITKYEDRITKYEDKLRRQFTNLEVTMSTLTSQSNFMASQSFMW